MQVFIPPTLTRKQEQALTTYLTDSRRLGTAGWRQVYHAINLLDQAQITFEGRIRSFRQLYNEVIDGSFADQYIDELLALNDMTQMSSALAATYVRKIEPSLEQAGLLRQSLPGNWLLLAYCVYWWQSFARGYAFEVEIFRDLGTVIK